MAALRFQNSVQCNFVAFWKTRCSRALLTELTTADTPPPRRSALLIDRVLGIVYLGRVRATPSQPSWSAGSHSPGLNTTAHPTPSCIQHPPRSRGVPSCSVRRPPSWGRADRPQHPKAHPSPVSFRPCLVWFCSAPPPSSPRRRSKRAPLPFVPHLRMPCPLALVNRLPAQDPSIPGRAPPKAALPSRPRHPAARPRPLHSRSCPARGWSAPSPWSPCCSCSISP